MLRADGTLPQGLTRRAHGFLWHHAAWAATWAPGEVRRHWLAHDVGTVGLDEAEALQSRWGGLCLPPAPQYDGGPLPIEVVYIRAGDEFGETGWWTECGSQRSALPYSFMVAPGGSFGILEASWVPLHASLDGWIESLALTYALNGRAAHVRRIVGSDRDALDLTNLEVVAEVQGRADTWWRGDDRLIAIYRGEALLFERDEYAIAFVYDGLKDVLL